jgi:conjugal transfer pilus assembly protein TraK
MSKFIAVFLLVVCAVPALAKEPPASGPIPAEITTAVALSSSDINRIVCPGTVNDLIFSEEKGIEGHFAGNSAFVKFKITKKGDELSYATTPTELYVICNNAVYSLIATPKRIPAVTLRLAPVGTDRLKANIARFQGLAFEKKVLQLVREAYTGQYPESYRLSAVDIPVNLSADLLVRLYRVVDIEGAGFRVKEFSVRAAGKDKGLQLDEKMFLKPDMGEGIAAVAVERHRIGPGESTRVFVVERKGDQP